MTMTTVFVISELYLSGATALLVGECACPVVGSKLDLSVLEVGAAPLLMQELIDVLALLLPLDVLHEGKHALLLEVTRENLRDKRVHMETREGNELPAVAHGGQVRDEVLNVLLRHLLGVPVEAGGEVVGEEDVRLDRVDAICELLGN